MNRIKDLVGAVKVGSSFVLQAKDIGMGDKEFDGYVDSLLNTAQLGLQASKPHRDDMGFYDAVVVTRTA